MSHSVNIEQTNTTTTAPQNVVSSIFPLPAGNNQREQDRRQRFQERRGELFRLQEWVQDTAKPQIKSVCDCFKYPIVPAGGTGLIYNKTTGKARLSGLHRCKSYHACPTCGYIRRIRKSFELSEVLDKHIEAGGSAYALHLTMDDRATGTIQNGLDLLTKCWNKLFSGRYGKELKEKYNFSGYFRAIETTYNLEKDWFHPHIHAVLTFDKRLSQFERDTLSRRLTQSWCKIVEKQSMGKNKPYNSLQMFEEIYDSGETAQYGSAISKYIMKVCVGASFEMANAGEKEGKGHSSYGIWELVKMATSFSRHSDEHKQIVRIFNQYASAGFKRRWFSSSRDFFNRYDVEEKEEAVFSEMEEPEEIVEVEIEVQEPVMRAFRNYKAVGHLLQATENQEEPFNDFLDILDDVENFEARERLKWKMSASLMPDTMKKTGESLGDVWDRTTREVDLKIEKYADTQVFYWIRNHIKKSGKISTRWFRTFYNYDHPINNQ